MSLQGCPQLDDEQRREALDEATDDRLADAARNSKRLILRSGEEEFASGRSWKELYIGNKLASDLVVRAAAKKGRPAKIQFINDNWKNVIEEHGWSGVSGWWRPPGQVKFNPKGDVVFINKAFEDDKILRLEFGETVTEEDEEEMEEERIKVEEKIFIDNKKVGYPRFVLHLSESVRIAANKRLAEHNKLMEKLKRIGVVESVERPKPLYKTLTQLLPGGDAEVGGLL